MKIAAYRYYANVKIAYAERVEKFRICAVSDLRVCDIGQNLVYSRLVYVNSHNLVTERIEMYGNMSAESAEAYK